MKHTPWQWDAPPPSPPPSAWHVHLAQVTFTACTCHWVTVSHRPSLSVSSCSHARTPPHNHSACTLCCVRPRDRALPPLRVCARAPLSTTPSSLLLEGERVHGVGPLDGTADWAAVIHLVTGCMGVRQGKLGPNRDTKKMTSHEIKFIPPPPKTKGCCVLALILLDHLSPPPSRHCTLLYANSQPH